MSHSGPEHAVPYGKSDSLHAVTRPVDPIGLGQTGSLQPPYHNVPVTHQPQSSSTLQGPVQDLSKQDADPPLPGPSPFTTDPIPPKQQSEHSHSRKASVIDGSNPHASFAPPPRGTYDQTPAFPGSSHSRPVSTTTTTTTPTVTPIAAGLYATNYSDQQSSHGTANRTSLSGPSSTTSSSWATSGLPSSSSGYPSSSSFATSSSSNYGPHSSYSTFATSTASSIPQKVTSVPVATRSIFGTPFQTFVADFPAFSLATYNVLNQNFIKPEYYPYTAGEPFMESGSRYELLAQQILQISTSIIALQEVSTAFYHFLMERLAMDKSNVYSFVPLESDTERDNVALIYKSSEWTLKEKNYYAPVPGKKKILVVTLNSVQYDFSLALFVVHLPGAPSEEGLRTDMIRNILANAPGFSASIILGDYNADPDAPCLNAITSHPQPEFKLFTPPYATFRTHDKTRRIDHVAYTYRQLTLLGHVDTNILATKHGVELDGKVRALPSPVQPSDHVPVIVYFKLPDGTMQRSSGSSSGNGSRDNMTTSAVGNVATKSMPPPSSSSSLSAHQPYQQYTSQYHVGGTTSQYGGFPSYPKH